MQMYSDERVARQDSCFQRDCTFKANFSDCAVHPTHSAHEYVVPCVKWHHKHEVQLSTGR